MCIGIPVEIISITNNLAKVKFSGLIADAILDLVPGVKVGDYVLLHAGFAIQVVSKGEAVEAFDLQQQWLEHGY